MIGLMAVALQTGGSFGTGKTCGKPSHREIDKRMTVRMAIGENAQPTRFVQTALSRGIRDYATGEHVGADADLMFRAPLSEPGTFRDWRRDEAANWAKVQSREEAFLA